MSYPPGHPALARADAAGTFVGWLLVAIAIATAAAEGMAGRGAVLPRAEGHAVSKSNPMHYGPEPGPDYFDDDNTYAAPARPLQRAQLTESKQWDSPQPSPQAVSPRPPSACTSPAATD